MSPRDEQDETSTFFKGDTTVSGEATFIKFCPELARRIGMPMALVLQHIYFRLSNAEPGKHGIRWAQIRSTEFTKWTNLCKKTIRNAVEDLRENNLIFVPTMEELKKAKRNISNGIWYSINEAEVRDMMNNGMKLKRIKRTKAVKSKKAKCA